MITIAYKGELQKISTAVKCANSLLCDPAFYNNIAEYQQFDMTDLPPKNISCLIQNTDLNMRVLMYIASPRVHGYDDEFNPDLIHINVFRSDWTIASVVNTIIHQVVHAVGSLHPELYFGHGDSAAEGKENTAPYKIAAIAEQMLTGKPANTFMVHDPPPETYAVDIMN